MNNFKWKSQQLLGFPVSFGVLLPQRIRIGRGMSCTKPFVRRICCWTPVLGATTSRITGASDGKCGKAGHAQNQVWFWMKRATYNQWLLTSWAIHKFDFCKWRWFYSATNQYKRNDLRIVSMVHMVSWVDHERGSGIWLRSDAVWCFKLRILTQKTML